MTALVKCMRADTTLGRPLGRGRGRGARGRARGPVASTACSELWQQCHHHPPAPTGLLYAFLFDSQRAVWERLRS